MCFPKEEKNPLLKVEWKLKSNNGQKKIFAPVITDKGSQVVNWKLKHKFSTKIQ